MSRVPKRGLCGQNGCAGQVGVSRVMDGYPLICWSMILKVLEDVF